MRIYATGGRGIVISRRILYGVQIQVIIRHGGVGSISSWNGMKTSASGVSPLAQDQVILRNADMVRNEEMVSNDVIGIEVQPYLCIS